MTHTTSKPRVEIQGTNTPFIQKKQNHETKERTTTAVRGTNDELAESYRCWDKNGGDGVMLLFALLFVLLYCTRQKRTIQLLLGV